MFDFVKPRQTIIVTSRGETTLLGKEVKKDNLFTLTWHMPLSVEPFLYGIVVSRERFSYKLIKNSKVFCVNFMAHQYKDAVLYAGSKTGMTHDKFPKSGLTKIEAESIDCCKLREASAWLECEVIDEIDTGDHVIFVGKVLKYKEVDDKKRLFYLGGGRFTSTI